MLFDFPEIVIICGVALVVLGPKKLPATAAKIGRWVGRARAMARQFKDQLELEVNSVDTALDAKPRDPTIHNPASSTPSNAPSGTHEDFAAGLAATGVPSPPPAAPATPSRGSDNHGDETAATSASDAAHR